MLQKNLPKNNALVCLVLKELESARLINLLDLIRLRHLSFVFFFLFLILCVFWSRFLYKNFDILCIISCIKEKIRLYISLILIEYSLKDFNLFKMLELIA